MPSKMDVRVQQDPSSSLACSLCKAHAVELIYMWRHSPDDWYVHIDCVIVVTVNPLLYYQYKSRLPMHTDLSLGADLRVNKILLPSLLVLNMRLATTYNFVVNDSKNPLLICSHSEDNIALACAGAGSLHKSGQNKQSVCARGSLYMPGRSCCKGGSRDCGAPRPAHHAHLVDLLPG